MHNGSKEAFYGRVDLWPHYGKRGSFYCACGRRLARVQIHYFLLKRASEGLPDNTTPPRKVGSGSKKTTQRTDAYLTEWGNGKPINYRCCLEKKLPMLPQDVSIRTIQHRLDDLLMPFSVRNSPSGHVQVYDHTHNRSSLF